MQFHGFPRRGTFPTGYGVFLAADGAHVTIGDIDLEGAQGTVAAVEAAGGRATAMACDVRDADQVRALVSAASSAGRLDTVVGVAGLLRTAPLADLSVDAFEAHLAINLTANLVLAQAAAPALADAGGGSIVLMASLAASAERPVPLPTTHPRGASST